MKRRIHKINTMRRKSSCKKKIWFRSNILIHLAIFWGSIYIIVVLTIMQILHQNIGSFIKILFLNHIFILQDDLFWDGVCFIFLRAFRDIWILERCTFFGFSKSQYSFHQSRYLYFVSIFVHQMFLFCSYLYLLICLTSFNLFSRAVL